MRSDFYLKTYNDTSPNHKKKYHQMSTARGIDSRQCLVLIDGGLDGRRDCGALWLEDELRYRKQPSVQRKYSSSSRSTKCSIGCRRYVVHWIARFPRTHACNSTAGAVCFTKQVVMSWSLL